MEVGGTNRADPDAAAPVVVVVRTLYGTYRLVHQPFKSLLAGAHRLSSYSLSLSISSTAGSKVN